MTFIYCGYILQQRETNSVEGVIKYDSKKISLFAGLIFAVVAVFHALRLLYGWEVVINAWAVPVWISGAGVMVTAYLAYHGLRLRK